MAEHDYDRIKGNVRRMIDGGASEDEIDTYLGSENVTPAQLRGEENFFERGLGGTTRALGNIGYKIGQAVKGKQDPAFADLGDFRGEGLNEGPTGGALHNLAGALTVKDTGYGDIIKSQLGDALLNVETDENGYEVITYVGDDGKTYRSYINKPGLDTQDVKRGLLGAAPYLLGGGVAGAGLKGLGAGIATRMLGQGATEAGVSIGQDIAATAAGSEDGIDLGKALFSAGGAAVFEGLSPAVAAGWRALIRRNGIDNKTGRLTEAAARKAREAGLDPDDMDERLARQFAADAAAATDAEEVAGKFRPGEFGIETTVGQRTKLPNKLGVEEEMRRGLIGRHAQDIMRSFDEAQERSIRDASLEMVPGRIAPGASSRDVRGLGGTIQDQARAGRTALENRESAIWSEVGAMYPTRGGLARLPGALGERINASGIMPDRTLTPTAASMMDTLGDFAKGTQRKSEFSLLPEFETRLDIDTVRRRLLASYKGANPGTDMAASKAIYDGFNDWIDDVARMAEVEGDVAAAATLRSARAFTKNLHQLLSPSLKGKQTAGARILERVLDKADSPEGVVTALFGGSSTKSRPREGTVQALKNLKNLLNISNRQAWDDVRMAYWVNLALDNRGRVLSPGRLQSSIESAFSNQGSVLDVLYSKQEQELIRRLGRALEDVVYTPPNPSGTSYELQRMQQRRNTGARGLAKGALQTHATRERFSKHRILTANIFQALARKIAVNPLGVREGLGTTLARRATDQRVARPKPPSLAPLGGAAGAFEEEGSIMPLGGY